MGSVKAKGRRSIGVSFLLIQGQVKGRGGVSLFFLFSYRSLSLSVASLLCCWDPQSAIDGSARPPQAFVPIHDSVEPIS